MASKAKTGLGTILSITSGTPGTFAPIAEIRTLKQSGRKAETDDVTNFDSAQKEFITTIVDPGEWDLEGNYIPSDAGQVALETAFQSLEKTTYKIVSGTTTFQFDAVITDLNYTLDPQKATTFSSKLKVSGAMTITQGA